MRDFLLQSIRFFFSWAYDLKHSCINIDARIILKGVRKIKRSIFSLSLKFLHGIRVNSEPFNPSMTKYRMATKDSSTLEVTSTQEAPILRNNEGSDGVTLVITRHKTNGQNHLQWSHAVMMFICCREKDDYLIGAMPRPTKENRKFKAWKVENNMVMSWLINSMNNDIGENFILYETTQ